MTLGCSNAGTVTSSCTNTQINCNIDTDCDDSDLTINPGATEACGDGLDNNCDGNIDDDGIGGFVWHADSDGDTFGDPIVSMSACDQPVGFVVDETDCNDADAAVNPGAPEVCGDGINNDCSIVTLDIFDADGDTYACDVDCDDNDISVNPGAVETSCDGIDNDCNAGTADASDSDSDLFDVCGSGDPVNRIRRCSDSGARIKRTRRRGRK